ncbi:peptidase S8/S53 domain-containing protein [Umbelopsis sp. PMI_123]|nr:peptidase S8/S53 domain-containing protein [Umbelopsis sp. PMI_123]
MLSRFYSLYFATLLLLSTSSYAQDTTSSNTATSGNYIVVLKHNATEATVQTHLSWMSKYLAINGTHHSLNSTTRQHTTTPPSLNYTSIGNFKWYSGNFHSTAIDSLTNGTAQDVVHYVVEDITLNTQELIQPDVPSWGIDRIDQRSGTDGEYRFPSSQGNGVTIYVVDTGMDISHSDIVGRASYGPTFIGNTSDPTDSNGHGTFVAGVCIGTRYGVAKQANVVSVKALNADGDGQLSNVLKALSWIVEQYQNNTSVKSIVNLSLGANYNQATNDAVEEAIALGIHFAIAAGNYGMDACQFSPASAKGALVVGAIDEDDSVSYYSNFGACVDIFAPGTNIKSIWNTGSDSTNTLTGTSMASPHAAGVMALYLSENNYNTSELIQYMKHVSTLLREDFLINNGSAIKNPNETVLDNGVTDGYKVTNPNINVNESTPANILYNHPMDDKQVLVYDQPVQGASSSLHATVFTMLSSSTFALACALFL